jgi:hypothetical protein
MEHETFDSCVGACQRRWHSKRARKQSCETASAHQGRDKRASESKESEDRVHFAG